MGRKCLLQQLLDSNVRQIMQLSPSGAMSLFVLRRLLADIMRGLYVLHATGFVHADLKPDNLLWSAQDGCLKVIDFSLSFHCEDKVVGLIQSQGYRAPEVTTWNANRQKQVQIDLFSATTDEVKPCSACDMWSVGCILVEMFSSSKLFTQNRLKEIFPSHVRAPLKFIFSIFILSLKNCRMPTKALLTCQLELLNPNPGLRLSACEALLHPALATPFPGPDYADLLVLPSPILRMMNLTENLTNEDAVKEAEEDVHQMCSQFGSVLQCFACRSGQGQGKIFVHFSYAHQAVTAFHSLSSVTYNGHSVILTYFPLDSWHQRQLF
ncbi:hypothetical protein CAPTEDRAFT_93191 [Capitella teleta]|uniref:Protein kinase domain-containing protein n=1 Tax=Capitella teleta TaxID=283909 RepID=X2BBW3_CAPTE|nr:hypothetical protein CAPTEDRAFT_93191 [Capitella teleta]|eukprot:ELU10086.1 hypothetical protein CAPTEDRAFT_93191 [Capitella teleta]